MLGRATEKTGKADVVNILIRDFPAGKPYNDLVRLKGKLKKLSGETEFSWRDFGLYCMKFCGPGDTLGGAGKRPRAVKKIMVIGLPFEAYMHLARFKRRPKTRPWRDLFLYFRDQLLKEEKRGALKVRG